MLKTIGSLLGVAGGLEIGAEPAKAFLEDVTSPFTGRPTRAEQGQQAAWNMMPPAVVQQRVQRVQQAMAFNEAMLASRYPGVYAKLLAGRPLPRGAVVYGGQPNREAVDATTYAMATGKMQPPMVQ